MRGRRLTACRFGIIGFLRDRPRESLIFQCFRDIGPVATPIFASLGCFLPGGDPNRFLGDRPRESLIFQCFRDIGPVATPIFASLGCFLPGGDPKTNSYSIHFSFPEMWYDASVDAGSVGRKDHKWQGLQGSRSRTTEPRDTTSCRAPTTGASCSRRGG